MVNISGSPSGAEPLDILIGTAWANTLYYGPEISYNASLTDANNSYVHQGDNITQGNYYDLSGIYGFSGILAHWNDDFDNAGVTEPDYMFTIISPYAVYIDPAKFPVGRWYQWDGGVGCYGGTNTNNNGGTILGATPTPTYNEAGLCTNGFGNDNAYVFAVVAPVAAPVVPVVHTMNVTETVGNQTIIIPITYTETVTATPTSVISNAQTIVVPTTVDTSSTTEPGQSNAVDINGDPINGVSTNFQSVTPSPVPVDVTLCGLVGAIGILVWGREKR